MDNKQIGPAVFSGFVAVPVGFVLCYLADLIYPTKDFIWAMAACLCASFISAFVGHSICVYRSKAKK